MKNKRSMLSLLFIFTVIIVIFSIKPVIYILIGVGIAFFVNRFIKKHSKRKNIWDDRDIYL